VKFSIITPSYNQFAYLKLCTASVADQAGVEFEHIIQDAGTGGDLESWASSLDHVRLFIERDEGMYDAINRGLHRASGEICAYLNCDEQYLPGALRKVAQFFAAHPAVDVLFGDVILIDHQGHPLSYRRVILPTLEHVRLVHLNTPTCATFFRRTLLERGFYFDSKWKVIGDAVWMEDLLKNKIVMATLREPLAIFTFTGENLGATALSGLETIEWQGNARKNSIKRFVASVFHRFRKATAGAYRRRHVEIEIFTDESPHLRQNRSANVGFIWPGRLVKR
jgi:glycosyltransferase involved in cell wall biosynthesis